MNAPLLRVATPPAWVEWARAQVPLLLIDHANCEKKAASTALALMFAYAEDLHLTRIYGEYDRYFKLKPKLSFALNTAELAGAWLDATAGMEWQLMWML